MQTFLLSHARHLRLVSPDLLYTLNGRSSFQTMPVSVVFTISPSGTRQQIIPRVVLTTISPLSDGVSSLFSTPILRSSGHARVALRKLVMTRHISSVRISPLTHVSHASCHEPSPPNLPRTCGTSFNARPRVHQGPWPKIRHEVYVLCARRHRALILASGNRVFG